MMAAVRGSRRRRDSSPAWFRLPSGVVAVVVSLSLAGCLSPQNADRSTVVNPEPLEQQRANTQLHDPFPRDDLGPGESLRPRDFQTSRDTPRKIREKTLGAALRERYGRPTNVVPPAGF